MMDRNPFTEILSRLRRSIRNKERLHLDQAHVLALVTSPIYSELARLEAEELARECQSKFESVNSGSHGEPTGANGRSAGMTEPQEPAVESRLVSAITMQAIRQSKRSKPLPITSQPSVSPKRSTPNLTIASRE